MRLSLFLAMVCIPLPSLAQQGEAQDTIQRSGPYYGVQPGTQELAPNKSALRSRGAIRIISWVGFQMLGQGGRVFVQSTEPPEFELLGTEPDLIVVDFPNSRLHSKNDGHRLETGWFPSAVLWVEAKQRRNNVTRVFIKLREVVGYDVRQEGNYVFLDFRPPKGPISAPEVAPAEPE